MSLLKSLLRTQNPLFTPNKSLPLSSIFIRTLIASPRIEPQTIENTNKHKTPLHLLFREAVGLCEKAEENSESESENVGLKKRLRKLEREVRDLKVKGRESRENVKKPKEVESEKPKKVESLHRLFTGKMEKQAVMEREEETRVLKELSPDMEFFVNHLYREGYLRKANFLPGNKLDLSCFENSYGMDFIKFAAEKFGKDHQEIAKWLSGSDLKKVALFGCPSTAKNVVFSAKRLRKFFEIQEDTVCSKCVLKKSCKFVNQSVWKGDTGTLNLSVVMRVITLYGLEWVPRQLAVPVEIKASVSRLLEEVINLSKTIS